MDKLHFEHDGRLVARTCWSCDGVLSLSDYNAVICERCEEPQPQDRQPTAQEAGCLRKHGIEGTDCTCPISVHESVMEDVMIGRT